MTKYANDFYWGFIIAALVCFAPSKILAYGVAYIFLGYLVIRNTEVKKTLVSLYSLLIVGGISYLFYYSLYGNTVFQNYFLAILTYSSFLPVIILDNRKLAQPFLIKKILIFLSALFLIEGGWGIMQAFYGAVILDRGFDGSNGDHVEGTIHPQLEAELAFSNPMFVVNMSFIGLALLMQYFVFGDCKKLRLFVGFLSIILASVIHVLLLAFASAVFFYILIRPRFALIDKAKATISAKLRRTSVKASMVVFVSFIIVAPIYFLSHNVGLIESFATKTFLAQTPKAKITIDAFDKIPNRYPSFPIVGFGPGQFTSRASLIGSGVYLGGVDNPTPPPLLQSKMNPVADKTVIPYLYESQRKTYLGSTGFPHYSWLSVYSEMGLLGFMGITGFAIHLLLRAMNRANKSKTHRLVAYLFCTGLGLLYLLGIHENYWEVPQAIFLGVLILKLLYAALMELDNFKDIKYGLLSKEEFEGHLIQE